MNQSSIDMKQLFLFGSSILLLIACESSAKHEESSSSSQVQEKEEVTEGFDASADAKEKGIENTLSQNNNEVKLVMHPVQDARRGLVAYKMPLPSDWRIHDKAKAGQPYITGPGSVKVFNYGARNFMYSNDVMMQQSYQMSGQEMRMPVGVEQVVKEDLLPFANKEGLTLIDQYHVSELIAYDKSYYGMLYQVGPAQNSFDVLATEWKDASGNPSLMIVRYMESASYGSVYWYYTITAMESAPSSFENAKKDLIHGLANIQNNPAQIQAHNQEEAQKSNASWAAHNQRMKSNQASFDQTQRAIKSSNDAINQSMMSTWESQNASSDRIQNSTINSIHEEHTVVDPMNGQSYQVEAGYERYWTNGQGEYKRSNDQFYEPGMDPDLNGENWNEVEIE